MQVTLNQEITATNVSIIHQSFLWMCIGLSITAFSSLLVASNQTLVNAISANSLVFFGLIIAELALVFFLSVRITKISFETALVSFLAYSLLNGVTLSAIFLLYTGASIVSTFFVSAGAFGIMALYGYTTKKDLTTIGNLALMALFGIILASIVNIFLHNDAFGFVLSCIAVIIFIGLTAYDTQKIKQLAYTSRSANFGIVGALTLYLDFINIFLNLLRIMGRRRD